jgi:hypothetical protein
MGGGGGDCWRGGSLARAFSPLIVVVGVTWAFARGGSPLAPTQATVARAFSPLIVVLG